MSSSLLYEIQGSVARLILNRPKAMNSINLEMISLFEVHLPAIAADNSIKVLILSGVGPAFCAGADLKEVLASGDLPTGEADFLDRVYSNVMAPLRNFPKPVIVALNGLAMAGGLELAMCADIVIAADTVKIGDGHANYGVYPGAGGASVLPRLVPHNVAKYLLLTGKTLSAKEMKGYGFVNEVVSLEQLAPHAQSLAQHMAKLSAIVLRRMKIVANASMDKSRDQALEHEQVHLRQHMRSYDMQEGLNAFAEKRQPEFRGS